MLANLLPERFSAIIAGVLLGLVLILLVAAMGLVLFLLRPPTALVLPLAAIVIALVALAPRMLAGELSAPLTTLFNDVVFGGFLRLAPAIVAVFLGAVLAAQVSEAGIARAIVRVSAEFAGDSPFLLSLLLLLVIAMLFTSLGGLGAVIMVATTVLPLLLALGLDALTAGAIFLFGLSLGGALNPINWQLYISVLGLEQGQIVPYALAVFVIFLVVASAFVGYKIQRGQGIRAAEGLWIGAIAGIFVLVGVACFRWGTFLTGAKMVLFVFLGLALAFLTLGVVARSFAPRRIFPARVNPLSVCALVYPLLMVLFVNLGNSLGWLQGFTMELVAALFIGVVYAHLASLQPGGGESDRILRACYEGFRLAIPAILLLFGIGMLLKATTLPEVAVAVKPLMSAAIPATPLAFVIGFTVFAPLALYRGPLNLYGMGSGIVGLMLAVGRLAAPLVMVAFFSVGMMQGVSDPTNTHNAWLAGYLKVRVMDLTRVTVGWVFGIVFGGLLAGVLMFGL